MMCDNCIHKKVCTAQFLKETESCSRFKDENDYTKVVRCKDCTEWDKNDGECCHWYGFKENDYCSYGIRKEENK